MNPPEVTLIMFLLPFYNVTLSYMILLALMKIRAYGSKALQ